MECLFRTHMVLEMIDKETGEVVYREVSKSKEFDTLVEMLGYAGSEDIESHLTVKDELITYDDDGFPKEPDVRTHELSEDVKKVVYDEATTEPDAIFADMDIPEADSKEDVDVAVEALAGIDNTTLTEALASDTDTVNEFNEVSDMSLDLNDGDGKEDKSYSVEDIFVNHDDDAKETPVSESDSTDVSGIDLSFAFGEPEAVVESDSQSVVAPVDVVVDNGGDNPFENAEEEDTYKARLNRLDNLFQ